MGKVLLVVEGELYGRILARAFQDKGFEVCGVCDCGETAIEHALTEQPEIVLLDFLLHGGLNGIETAAQIKATVPADMFLLNNRLEPIWVDRAHKIGVRAILEKQISPAHIVDQVADFQASRTSAAINQCRNNGLVSSFPP